VDWAVAGSVANIKRRNEGRKTGGLSYGRRVRGKGGKPVAGRSRLKNVGVEGMGVDFFSIKRGYLGD